MCRDNKKITTFANRFKNGEIAQMVRAQDS